MAERNVGPGMLQYTVSPCAIAGHKHKEIHDGQIVCYDLLLVWDKVYN